MTPTKQLQQHINQVFGFRSTHKTRQPKRLYFVEVTDTFSGEANYCWVNRYTISASSEYRAITKLSRETGYYFRRDGSNRYDVPGTGVCAFIQDYDNALHGEFKTREL